MRTPVVVVSTLLAVAALQGTASAASVPRVALHSCDLVLTNESGDCLVVLDANPDGGFGQDTWSGWGSADLLCKVSGKHFHFEGEYGSEFVAWSHDADVCTLHVQAGGGTAEGYVF